MEKETAVVFTGFNNYDQYKNHQDLEKKSVFIENTLQEIEDCKKEGVTSWLLLSARGLSKYRRSAKQLIDINGKEINNIEKHRVFIKTSEAGMEESSQYLISEGLEIINNDIPLNNYPYIKEEYLKRKKLEITLDEFNQFNIVATGRINNYFPPVKKPKKIQIPEEFKSCDPGSLEYRVWQIMVENNKNIENDNYEEQENKKRDDNIAKVKKIYENIAQLARHRKIFFKTIQKGSSFIYDLEDPTEIDSYTMTMLAHGHEEMLAVEPIEFVTDNLDGKTRNKEYRCMVTNNQIASISRCIIEKTTNNYSIPLEINDFAEQFIKDHRDVPQINNKDYSLDIGETIDRGLVVVELNPLYASGSYNRNNFANIARILTNK